MRIAPILTLLILAASTLAAASPHDEPQPTDPADDLVASWDNSLDEATDGGTAPWVAQRMAENAERNVRPRLGGEGLAAWPWGADHPDHQSPPGLVLPVAFQSAAGWRLEGDVWLPPDVALVEGRLVGPTHPGLVLTPGFSAGRDMYAWLLERLAGDGYVVLAWDPQGQGTSHGSAASAQDYENDLKRAIDWFHGDLNPARDVLDHRFGLVGHSQGGNAAYWLGNEPGYAGKVRALVALSSSWLNESVPFPVQTWTGDYDGGFAQPSYLGLNYGATDYEDLKPKYDAHLAGDKQLLVLRGATHDSWTNIPFVYGDGRTHDLTWHYAKPFLDRYVRGDATRATYDAVVTPVEGLSRAYPSEYALAGEAARMMQPIGASLGQDPEPFLARWSGADAAGDCRVAGFVHDVDGRQVAGAVVTLDDGRTLTTDHEGWFAFHGVPDVGVANARHPYAGALTVDAATRCRQVAPSPASIAIGPGDAPRTWQGRHFTGTGVDPGACTPTTCDLVDLRVEAPATPYAVEVSIRWESEQDDFELALVDAATGEEVARSGGGFSIAESLIVENLPAGDYRVVVSPLAADDAHYDGLVEIEPRPDLPPVGLQYPNLVTLAPDNLRVVAPAFYATGTPVTFGNQRVFSCYADETAETGARRCLRFDNVIANTGDGRLEVRFLVDDLATEGQQGLMTQRIHRADGTWLDRAAGEYEWHKTHAHVHYADFARYALHEVDEATGERGAAVGDGVKAGFCAIDVELLWWAHEGNDPRRHSFPRCNVPTETNEQGSWMVQGIGRGWADVYTWDLPGQYVDITGVPDGVYDLVVVTDPLDTLAETDETDNTASVRLRLQGDEVTVLR